MFLIMLFKVFFFAGLMTLKSKKKPKFLLSKSSKHQTVMLGCRAQTVRFTPQVKLAPLFSPK